MDAKLLGEKVVGSRMFTVLNDQIINYKRRKKLEQSDHT